MSKSNKFLIIFLLILVFIGIGGSIFVFRDRIPFLKDNFKKEESNIVETKPTVEKKEQDIDTNKYENIEIEKSTSTEEMIATSTTEDLLATTTEMINATTSNIFYSVLNDSDGDGLYDYEEEEVYNTDYLILDTDGDGFTDKEEIDKGFNPLGEGQLATNTPEFLLKAIEIARHNCDGINYRNKINYLTKEELITSSLIDTDQNNTEDFIKSINDNIDNWLELNIPVDRLEEIVITQKENISDIKIKFTYKLFYEDKDSLVASTSLSYSEMVSPRKNYDLFQDYTLYFIKINNKWKIDNYLNTFNDMTLEAAELDLDQKKIVSDINEIQAALNMYYLDHSVYPVDIYPDIATGTTIYLSTPLNRSKFFACPSLNEYTYREKSTSTDYTLSYCLEKEIENIPSGINIAKPDIMSTRKKFDIVYKTCKKIEEQATSTMDDLSEQSKISTSTLEDMVIEEDISTTTLDIKNEELDTDGDGLSDLDELFYKTDPENEDTDGDGYSDGNEVKNGYNPLGEGLLI